MVDLAAAASYMHLLEALSSMRALGALQGASTFEYMQPRAEPCSAQVQAPYWVLKPLRAS